MTNGTESPPAFLRKTRVRNFLKRSDAVQLLYHDANCRDVDDGFARRKQDLVALAESVMMVAPNKGALCHPALRQNGEALLLVIGARDDL